ncbi:MAG: hypothetical protein ACI89X_001459 [Planctomycetota bacterium]|jgi:hypothetical protein
MFAIPSIALLCLVIPQEPNKVLATYQLNGEEATVTRTDVAMEMAFHLRRDERGRQGCEMMVDAMVTRTEAKRLNVMPTTADAQAFWTQLKQQLIEAGRRPEDFAAVRNTSEAQWLEDLSVQIAQERVVRKELGLAEDEKVGGDMLKLWLVEARENAKIETDPDKLPVGTAANVNGKAIALIDLGFLLLRTSEDFERDRIVRQIVVLQTLESMAREKAIKITEGDLDRAIESRRVQAQKDPKLGGVPFEQVLKARGMTVDSLRQLRVFRSYILLEKLVAIQFTDEKLQAELDADRDAMLAEVGPRRRIGAIYLRAIENPNQIITRNFDDAMAHLQVVRARIAIDGFAATASIESELGDSKRKGGDVGWHRKGSTELPKNVVHAAFEMKMTEVSMPIRTKDGCYIITVLDREPVPTDKELISRTRIIRGRTLSESVLENAKVQFAGAKKTDMSETKSGTGTNK